MKGAGMRLAVITNQFPSRVSTFFARDMRALIEAGIEIDILPIYSLDPSLWKYVPEILSESILPRSRVHHIGARQAARQFRSNLRESNGFLREARPVLTSARRFGLLPLAKTLYILPKTLAWARRYAGQFDHVLGYWGNYAGTAALLLARSVQPEIPFSLFLHAGTDLYRDQVYLPEKIEAARQVITCSDFNRAYLKQHFPALFPALDHKLHVYHHGLDFSEFPFTLADRQPDRVIAVGNFKKAKGFDYLLRAGKLLKDRGTPFTIEMVGDGEQRQELEQLAAELGITDQVIFRGWLPFDQVRTVMTHAAILVHPSAGLGDGVPNVIKEAIALGTPVVASDVSGIPEALAGGQHGLLVPPRDSAGLADAIERLLASPQLRAQFARDGRRYVEGKYDLWRNGRVLADTLLVPNQLEEPVHA
jgi:glycosyltransferase involved in cell wall biosynthesis